jgi:hypothetical protein
MVEDNQHYAYFAISGSFDPIDITERIGVRPTECWKQGDISHRTHRERKFSKWSLYSRLEREARRQGGRNYDLETHIRDVLAQLDLSTATFASVSQEFGGWMQLVSYLHCNYPGLHFDRDITEGLARYSLSVDFDFYWLYSHDRESTD